MEGVYTSSHPFGGVMTTLQLFGTNIINDQQSEYWLQNRTCRTKMKNGQVTFILMAFIT